MFVCQAFPLPGKKEAGCKSGALGCFECKMNCASKISAVLEPIIEKRKRYEVRKDQVLEILIDGEKRARKIAQDTMQEVHEKMKLG